MSERPHTVTISIEVRIHSLCVQAIRSNQPATASDCVVTQVALFARDHNEKEKRWKNHEEEKAIERLVKVEARPTKSHIVNTLILYAFMIGLLGGALCLHDSRRGDYSLLEASIKQTVKRND